MSATSIPQLLLHPKSCLQHADNLSRLKNQLQQLGLIASADEAPYHLPGEHFLQLLTFLGCSPDIALSPEQGDHFCRIVVNDIQPEASCLGHTSSIKPGCPVCKTRLSHWQQTPNWQQAATLLNCPHCHTASAMHQWKWRHECAWGRFALAIHYIHPHEAVPSETLLAALEDCTGLEWDFSYITQQVTP